MEKGFWTGAAAAALASFVVALAVMGNGYSTFDDGSYAWALRELHAGATLHKDLPWPHPGYVLWIMLPFADYLDGDLIRFRYVVPPLAAMTAAGCALLMRVGALRGAVVGVVVAAMGFAQFSTFSASWFSVAFTVACLLCVHSACTSSQSWRWLFSAGLMAGLALGFRGPNGLAAILAAVALWVHGPSTRGGGGGDAARFVLLILTLVLGAGLIALAHDAGRVYLVFPPLTLALLTLLRLRGAGAAVRWPDLGWFALGVCVAMLPLLGWAIARGGLFALVDDMVRIPIQITQGAGSVEDGNIQDLASSLLGSIMAGGGWARWIEWGVVASFLFSPLVLVLLMVRNRDLYGRPILILAAISCIGILVHPRLIYACYLWPFTALALIETKSARAWAWGGMLVAAAAFLLVYPRGGIPGSRAYVSDGFSPTHGDFEFARCPLPRCSLYGDSRVMADFGRDVQVLASNLTSDQPVLVLPSFANYAYFLDNPSPFTLNRYDYTGSAEQVARFRADFMAAAGLTVAFRSADIAKYEGVLRGFCPKQEDRGWTFMTRCGCSDSASGEGVACTD